MASNPTLGRAAQLERAAKIRALLVSYINKQNSYVSVHDIEVGLRDQLLVLGDVATSTIPFQLKMLAANDLITGSKENGKCVYIKKDTTISKPTQLIKKKVNDDITPVNIQVDFIKSTGRVRFLLNGIVIEIGVI